jgi:hypothetical protein
MCSGAAAAATAGPSGPAAATARTGSGSGSAGTGLEPIDIEGELPSAVAIDPGAAEMPRGV